MAKASRRRPGLGTLVLIGFLLGIFCGLFFGEAAAVLSPVGTAYVRLLQMAIIPYIMVSLIGGLGRLTPQQASRVALWGGTVLLLILAIGMVLVLCIPLSYPDWESASYFSSSLASSSRDVDFVSLYIPANPFESLANTVVPAVVLFSIATGVAVMMSERKNSLLELLASLDDALMNITRFVVKLAPFGIFAIAANAAGTLDLSAFGKLQVYVGSYLLVWALLFFVFLPGLLVSLTPVSYRELFSTFRIPFITAFVTGSVLVVLPMMIEGIRALLEKHQAADQETDAAVDVLIPTTFNFPGVAMLLALSFILFSGWYAGSELSAQRYPLFASVGIFVAFGGSNIALPFMLDMFRLPADMFDLFLVANVITNFFFMSLSAMNLVVLTLIAMFIIKRRLTPRPLLLGLLAALLLVGAPLMLKAASAIMDRAIAYEYRGYQEFVDRGLIARNVEVRTAEYRPGLPTLAADESRLSRITSSGWLRVGYSPDSLPWAFRNASGDLVGYDVELLHRIAAQLDVNIEVLRIRNPEVGHALSSGQIDIYASGLMIDPGRVHELRFSKTYLDTSLGLLVEDHKREAFETLEQVNTASDAQLAVLNYPSLLRAIERSRPGRELVYLESPRRFLRGELPEVDALIMSAEAASAWTLVYPQYSAVIPTPGGLILPVALALPRDDEMFARFVDNWIQTALSLGAMDIAYEHWILGRESGERKPRWSIARDVLHWTD